MKSTKKYKLFHPKGFSRPTVIRKRKKNGKYYCSTDKNGNTKVLNKLEKLMTIRLHQLTYKLKKAAKAKKRYENH